MNKWTIRFIDDGTYDGVQMYDIITTEVSRLQSQGFELGFNPRYYYRTWSYWSYSVQHNNRHAMMLYRLSVSSCVPVEVDDVV